MNGIGSAIRLFFVVLLMTSLWPPDDVSAQTGGEESGRYGADPFVKARLRLVRDRLETAGIKDTKVLDAIRTVPRHEFIPRSHWDRAYFDMALPIGSAQTISSPFIVAMMTEALEPKYSDKILEIGTGSGYQAAVLSELVEQVYTIEIVPELGQSAQRVFEFLELENVHSRIGDGFVGWPEAAPFDKIIVTCSPEKVPQPLIDQLVEGGKIIVPVGERFQQTMYLMTKKDGKLVQQALRPTLFVPMTGTAEDARVELPDPANPTIVNGDFQQLIKAGEATTPDYVPGWYYGRQVSVVDNGTDQPMYVRFQNDTPGLASHLLQGLAIDGQKVKTIRVSAQCRTEGVIAAPEDGALPAMGVSFYDEIHQELGTAVIGPFRGTRPWRSRSRLIRVPAQTKEAIVRIGLFGATGTAEFDEVVIEKVGD